MTGPRPDFLCIGAQRAGTTWLHGMLRTHPGIFLPEAKELHFFDEPPDLGGYDGLGHPGRPRYFDPESRADWRWYRRQFRVAAPGQVRGEITPYYAVLSERRVALAAERLPGLRIIYVIRNPVRRAWSGFRLFWSAPENRGRALPDIETLRRTILHPAKLIHGDYRRNAALWEGRCGRERTLYLSFDDIVDRPRETLAAAARFLDADPGPFAAAALPGKINDAPGPEMPEPIEAALRDHFAGQSAWIEARFGRGLAL